jgi:HAD superfamily hydrolase (TIGR01509 family)
MAVTPSKMTVRAVVFDFDGLILDTETSSFESWCLAFEEHGCTPPTIEEWAAEVGTVGGLGVIALLESRAAMPLDVDALQIRRRAYRDDLLAREVARPGVIDWIDVAVGRGFGLAIASSSEREWVEHHLRRLGLRDHFAHLACYGTGLAPKPAPDTYLDACALLGVAPADAIAVEDSPHGVTAARAAGLRVVAVPNAVTAQMDLSAADLVITSLAECSLADVLARFDA